MYEGLTGEGEGEVNERRSDEAEQCGEVSLGAGETKEYMGMAELMGPLVRFRERPSALCAVVGGCAPECGNNPTGYSQRRVPTSVQCGRCKI